jgi:hypothetical protein
MFALDARANNLCQLIGLGEQKCNWFLALSGQKLS